MIYGERIRQARELCGLTQGELAKLVGVNQSAIAHIESGRNIPTQELLDLIAAQTEFLPSFFEKDSIENFPLGSLVFRSRASLSAREEAQAYQYAKTLFEQVKTMVSHLNIPDLRLPRISDNPITAAKVTRSSFALSPDKPIKKLVNTVEKNGILILSLPIVFDKLDAFSLWAEMDVERPMVIVSCNKPVDRLRFSIAHELGHLVMHGVLKGRVTEAEKEANRFAAEFLLPESAMKQELVPPITLTTVARLKPRWGVSMQSIIIRSYELGIITNRQYRYLFEQLSTRGWRIKEPSNLDLPEEKPQLFAKMIEHFYSDSKETIPESYGKDMHLTIKRARELVNIYADKRKFPQDGYIVSPMQWAYSNN
jgi:Zn-dependent peptidase ImmA (M78 family)/transcriptional regulator with XRE-family HTH domain